VLCWICEQRKLLSTHYSASRSSKVTVLGNVANQVRCSRTGTERPIDCARTRAVFLPAKCTEVHKGRVLSPETQQQP